MYKLPFRLGNSVLRIRAILRNIWQHYFQYLFHFEDV